MAFIKPLLPLALLLALVSVQAQAVCVDAESHAASAVAHELLDDGRRRRTKRKRRQVRDFWEHSAGLTDKEFKRFYRGSFLCC